MFVYFLWPAAFACAVIIRAHGAFSDRGTGVIVSPDEDALCAILVAFSAACESKFGLVYRLISRFQHYWHTDLGCLCSESSWTSTSKQDKMSLTYFAQSLGVTNLSFTFRLTRSPQSLQREWRRKVCSDNECSASHSIVYKHHTLAHITYLRLSSIAQQYFLVL